MERNLGSGFVECGVPQGSLLGPRLYTIYVNHFSSSIKSSEVHLYADDTTTFVIGDNTHQVTELLNILFEELNDWCDRNELTIHTGKSEAMIIQKRPFYSPTTTSQVWKKIIKYTEATKKLLGILVDNKLCWNKQIQKVCKSYGAKVKQLKKTMILANLCLGRDILQNNHSTSQILYFLMGELLHPSFLKIGMISP